MIVADRKSKWRALCEADTDVQYWRQTVDRVKAECGGNASVDDIVTDDSTVDLRRFHKGKKLREQLLLQSGLTREGTALVPLDGHKDELDSQIDTQVPSSRETKESSGGGNSDRQIIAMLTSLTSRLEGLESATLQRSSMGPLQVSPDHASTSSGAVGAAAKPTPKPPAGGKV